MRLISRHSPTIGRAFLFLFFLANSGFTVVLYRCTMEEPECCSTSGEAIACSCSTTVPPQATSGPAVTLGHDCHSMTIVGGLKTDPTVVEKDLAARAIRVNMAPAFIPNSPLSTSFPLIHPSAFTALHNVLPPAVETYVLNSTLLI